MSDDGEKLDPGLDLLIMVCVMVFAKLLDALPDTTGELRLSPDLALLLLLACTYWNECEERGVCCGE